MCGLKIVMGQGLGFLEYDVGTIIGLPCLFNLCIQVFRTRILHFLFMPIDYGYLRMEQPTLFVELEVPINFRATYLPFIR